MNLIYIINDDNFSHINEMKGELNELAEMFFMNNFHRESSEITVMFVDENEFQKINHNPHIDVNESNIDYFNPATEYLGIYIHFKEEFGKDLIVICPQRIKNICYAKNFRLDFSTLLKKVFIHELAHALLTNDPLSITENAVYAIDSCKLIEESLCNAFAMLHFSGREHKELTDFCCQQPPGYRNFSTWGNEHGSIIKSIETFREFKSKYSIDILVSASVKTKLPIFAINNNISVWPDYMSILNLMIQPEPMVKKVTAKESKFCNIIRNLCRLKDIYLIGGQFEPIKYGEVLMLLDKIGCKQLKNSKIYIHRGDKNLIICPQLNSFKYYTFINKHTALQVEEILNYTRE